MTLLLGRYEIRDTLGVGGMARVVGGYDQMLQRPVAIKLIHESLVDDPANRARLLREARGAGGLQHPNTVAVYDVGEDGGVPFIVMERVDGPSLAKVLERDGTLPVERTIDIVAGTLAGLAAAHARGLVHRDVKPSNVLLPADGGVKLADFGIARAMEEAATRLTGTGQVLGTPRYVAPEQAAGHPATPASDLYSVGVLAYECLAGRAPFEADTPLGLALAHQRDPVPPLTETAPGTPPALAAVVHRALAKDPDERFVDATSMRQAWEAAASRPLPDASTRPLATAAAGTAGLGTAATPTVRASATDLDEDAAGLSPATPRAPWRRASTVAVAAAALVTLAVFVFALVRPDPAVTDPTEQAAEPPQDEDAEASAEDGDNPSDGEEPPPDETVDAPPAEEDPTVTDAAALDELIAAVARDPGAAGEKGDDLLDELRKVRDEPDGDKRGDRARKLLDEVAGWLADDELDPEAAHAAIDVLEVQGRPADPRLVDASLLLAQVARDKGDWGENGDNLLDDLEKLLRTDESDKLAERVDDLLEDLDEWVDDDEIDRQRSVEAREVLQRLQAELR